jgi:3D (Asp-Asp-Asp) domain-containing protein
MLCSILFASWICFQPAPIYCPIYEYKNAIFTAFTLSEDETDSDPCVGAGNNNLCEIVKSGIRVCATRSLPLKTKIIIKGIGTCEILDKTNKKYSDRIDILFPTKKEAFKFGKKELEYRIIK